MLSHRNDLRIAIIGAGPAGLCMAIQLKKAGFENFIILEKAAGLGGTWYHNRYPGCACDIPSHLYSYSFEIKEDWSRPYAPQQEILEYLEHCSQKYGVEKHCRFECTVDRSVWDEKNNEWTLELRSGETLSANIVISAVGMFNDLNYPEIDGLERFEGTVFHSARWNWNHDLSGENVGVIGSAASAVQFVPEIVKQAKKVNYYQRTANWVLPKEDDPFTEETLAHLRSDPLAAKAIRDEIFNQLDSAGPGAFEMLRPHMESSGKQNLELVNDPALREKLTPQHPWGCKRPLFSNHYYPAFNQPNLELVTEPIEKLTTHSIVNIDGEEREIDTLILATGFQTTKYLSSINVIGRSGIDIQEAWNDGAQAYKGVTTAGFPNLFMLYGPNTNSDSLITMIEYHVEHALLHIQRIANEALDWIDVKADHMAAYNEQLQRDIAAVSVWHAGCTDYYRAPSGRIVTQWPHTMSTHQKMLAVLDLDAYETSPPESKLR